MADNLAFFGKFLLCWALAAIFGLLFIRYMGWQLSPALTMLGSFAGVFLGSLRWSK